MYPSFLRTVQPNNNTVDGIANIIEHFGWRWVAFLNSDNNFGIDGLELFIKRIKLTEICLAYNRAVNENTNFSQIFNQIEDQKINVIVLFAPKVYAEAVIKAAIELNITNKVWLADDGWSQNKYLPKLKGIKSIGTVLGVAQPVKSIPGFNDFIYSTKSQASCADAAQKTFCNQVCNCCDVLVEDIVTVDPSFSFAVYSAVYAIAQALHNILKCEVGRCDKNLTVQPYIVSKFSHCIHVLHFYNTLSLVYFVDNHSFVHVGLTMVLFHVHIRFYKNSKSPI